MLTRPVFAFAAVGTVALGCARFGFDLLPMDDRPGVAGDAGTGGARGTATGGSGGQAGGSDASGGAGTSSGMGGADGGTAGADGGADGGTGGADAGTDGGTGGADAGTDGADGGMDACGFVGPSCAGGLMCRGESCCTSLLVTGGTFNRSNNASYPATLGAFCLDKYEVTVGRFRKFHADYDRWISAAGGSHPTAGEGAHDSPVITGSGWDAGWKSSLPASAAVLTDGNHLKCSAPTQTWRDLPGSGTPDPENYPINCLSWFEAFAFCTWDGGFLPTEAQWEYAAAGGSEERIYPWGNVATEPLPANYANKHAASVVEVGSEPSGNGRWGQGDLAGSMFEWNLDYYGAFPVPCNDCFNRNVAASRVLRGGAWSNTADILPAAYRVAYTPSGVTEELGARCARTAR